MKITLNGSDITQQAAPLERSRTILVNVAALSAPLGLRVQIAGGNISIVDPSGTEWKARSGSLFLEAGSCRLTFVVPMQQQGSALYLPLETTAELAGATLKLDPTGQAAHLTLEHEESGAAVGDWQGFTLEKSAKEQENSEGSVSSNRLAASTLRQPSAHDNLTFGLGFGYLQGGGSNLQLTADGKYLGANVRFSAQLNPGARGSPLQNAQFWWQDQETGRAMELGSFYSDLWGGVSGGRYAWQAGKDHQPAVSLYLSSSNTSGYSNSPGSSNSPGLHPVLAFRDTYHVGGNTWLGGEIATDGSHYLQGRFQTKRVSGFAYYRYLATGSGGGEGGSLTYEIGHGLGVYADINRSTGQNDRNDSRTIGIHLPLPRQIDLSLEQTSSQTNSRSDRGYAATMSLPLGPLRVFMRYQTGHSAAVGLLPTAAPGDQSLQQMQTTVSYFANPRLRLELQSSASGSHGSFNSQREDFTTSYRLSGKTQFQITTTLPYGLNPLRNRLHLEHQLNNALSLTAEYGLPSFFQSERSNDASDGLTFMLRTHWMAPTPTRGGIVKGQVTDMAGVAVPNALVRLKDYETQTDAKGEYAFRNVPAGSYELNIVESSLAADCKAAQAPLLLTINSRSRKEIPLNVMPLHTITGHVYGEPDENDNADTGKAMIGIAISIEGFVTTTDKDGRFAFYKLEPRRHTVRLLAKNLPEDLALASPGEVVIELTPDHSVSGIVFRLRKHEKEIIFQDAK